MKSKTLIAIPTKGRPEVFRKFLQRHYSNEYDFAVTIEEGELSAYDSILEEYPAVRRNVLIVPDNAGLGLVRKLLSDAAIAGDYDFVFFADDNSKFEIRNLPRMIEYMEKKNYILWLGGYNDYYKLIHGKSSTPRNSSYESKYANCVYLIRVSILRSINFDPSLTYQEDNDLNLRMKAFSYPVNPIHVYRGLKFTKKRHAAGGATMFKTEKSIQRNAKLINTKFGFEVVKIDPNRKDARVSWSTFNKQMELRSK